MNFEGKKLLDGNFKAESSGHRSESFAKVFKDGAWGGKSKSGPGSELKNAGVIMKTLNVLVDAIKAATGKEKITLVLMKSQCST